MGMSWEFSGTYLDIKLKIPSLSLMPNENNEDKVLRIKEREI